MILFEFNYCTKLFHQTVHALSAKSCKTRGYTNVVCGSWKIPPLKLSPGVWYGSVISPQGAFWGGLKASPLWVNMLER